MTQQQIPQIQRRILIFIRVETFYEPYGEILEGGSESRYSYEGKEFSEVTEDYDYKFRKYDPELGIFTQPEQIFPNVYDPQQLNRYRFERNNPYKYVDENGKSPLAAIGIAAGIGAVVGAGFYMLEVAQGDVDFSLKGLGSYALGGIITGGVGAALVVFSAGIGTTVLFGGLSQMGSRVITNYGTNNPLSESVFGAGVLGATTGGLSRFLPGTLGLKNIKYFSSYFTKKSGQQFISNILLSEAVSTAWSTGNTYPQMFYSYINNQQISQINIAQQISSGCNPACQSCLPQSNQGSGGSSIEGYYYDEYGQGYCGIPPKSENPFDEPDFPFSKYL